jgi:predicted phage terminase large subunit-like protein
MYGKFVTDRWNETALKIAQRKHHRREPTIYHSGADSSTNGNHPDIIIVDDPVSEINSQNLDQIEKVYMHVRTLTPLLQTNGQILFILTRWRLDDLVHKLDVNQRKLFTVWSIKSCYGEDGQGKSIEDGLYAPEVLSRDFLEEAKETMGMYLFSANYLNNPVPDTDNSFQLEWLNTYEPNDKGYPIDMNAAGEIVSKQLTIYMSIDASYADKDTLSGKDPTAIVVVGFDNNGDSYLLEVFNKRISPTEVIDQLLRMAVKWDPVAIATEDVNTQKTLNPQIEEEMQKRRIFWPLVRIRHQQKSKRYRIMGLMPIFENRTFYYCPDLPNMDAFREQYMYFNPATQLTHDDILDALEMLETEFRKVYTEPEDDEEEAYEESFSVYNRYTGRM